ncbi:LacI family DNA-binding transcriptional regulator [Paremcibacter congregatus]|uniref:LacI family transcriptional regulator n=1 Tax=Paremcibacter congregatus TaxID=2043170 RepID=A0A2G4YUI6_9PROT|nr:LacI family DNA-binding transcriptional regulator [Paremcibacter congregatus]PHZ85126.1 LacI family transcriptional regulator [Paremcibacter congregatus]QDE27937.1 LacI family transcriptional regulator [Paremcibacter congregatus]
MKDDKPTSFDIAHLAGVSQPTVSRALRNSPLVSLETREKIQAIAKKLNYQVDINARNLRSKKTNTLALLFCEDPGSDNSLINPFFLSMLGSITRVSAQRGYDLLISFQQQSDDWNADYETAHRADGIIFLGYGDYITYVEKIAHLDRMGAHFITWGPVLPDQPGHFIGCDNLNSAHLATRHLIELGHKKIAFLGIASEHRPEFNQRYQGYVKALLDAKLMVNPKLQIDADTSEEMGYQATIELLKSKLQFDAIFGASDLIVIGAIKALKEHGLKVPADVAVVGFDNIPAAAYSNPPLTTIQQDTTLAGELLVDNLLRLIEGEEVASTLMPAKLIVRASSGAS